MEADGMVHHIIHFLAEEDTFVSSNLPDGAQSGIVHIAVVTDQMSLQEILSVTCSL
jgi:predicted xylose isomerase-like sugar epimerase